MSEETTEVENQEEDTQNEVDVTQKGQEREYTETEQKAMELG